MIQGCRFLFLAPGLETRIMTCYPYRVKHQGELLLKPRLRAMPAPRLARLIALPEEDYENYVLKLEQNPLFALLRNPPQNLPKVIRRAPSRFAFDGFYLFDSLAQDRVLAAEPDNFVFEGDPAALSLIRAIGPESFKKYFLYNDGEFDVEACAQACAVAPEQARQISRFVDLHLMRSPAIALPAGSSHNGQVMHYRVVASIVAAKKGWGINFLSSHYSRGVYRVDAAAFAAIGRALNFTPSQWEEARAVLGAVALINAKQNSLTQALASICDEQSAYFAGRRLEHMRLWRQNALAARLKLHPSTISRILWGRALKTPWGEIMPLVKFFPSRAAMIRRHIAGLQIEDPRARGRMIQKNLAQRYGIAVSLRLVNLYRKQHA